MTDRFDDELRRAIKESTASSLEGWEFTPAMRRAVLDRIAQESVSPSDAPASSRPRSRRIHPFMWATAAAAVLLVSFSAGRLMDQMGRSQKSADSQAPGMATELMLQAKPQAGALTMEAPASDAASITEEDLSRASGAGQPRTLSFGGASGNGAARKQIALVPPAAPSVPAPSVPDSAESGAQPERITLLAASAPEMLGLAQTRGGEPAVLTREAVRVLDKAGAVVWEQPLPEVPHAIAAADDGRIAVAAGLEIRLFDQAGEVLDTLELSAPAQSMEFSPDGRLAIVRGDQLMMYRQQPAVLYADVAAAGALDFAPDGTLGVVTREGEDFFAQLFSPEGIALAKVPLAGPAGALGFLVDGEYFFAGQEVFHRSGQPAWQVPFAASGAVSLGGDLVAWDEQEVRLLRGADGLELWAAEFVGGQILQVAASTAGDRLAVLGAGGAEGASDAAALVWVLDSSGNQQFAEALSDVPLAVSVEGESLTLLMPHGVEVRTLAP